MVQRRLEFCLRSLGPGCLVAALLAAGCSSPEIDDPGRDYDVARYDLKGAYDWSHSRLTATVGFTFSLSSDGAQSSAGSTSIVLDSRVEVSAVRLRGGAPLPFSADPERGTLRIDVSRVPGLTKGAQATIEIAYSASPSDSLVAVPARKGDPAAAPVVYSLSEPLGAASWMPCHNTPSDRAVFSIDMRMGEGEKMISNGELVADAVEPGAGHHMRYETAYTLPTYLMAFAIGDFEVESAKKGDLPVAVWHRRGVPGDYGVMLKELVRSIDTFEKLLVPYPFEKYAVVLLPDFKVGGEENASITFQRETGSAQPSLSSDLALMAHELGHQWFGDLVTVKTWDDLWIKEGMATLLASEGARAYTDESRAGTLNGDDFGVSDGEAVRDPSLKPDAKYTSGPYGRAAWLLTQIRSLVGEETFWKTLRGVLDQHRFGTIGTDELLDAFAPALGPEAAARARRAVDAKALPKLDVAEAASGGASVTLRDPDGALVAPVDVAWIAADGSKRAQTLDVDKAVALAPKQGGELLILDPLDRHPDLSSFIGDDEGQKRFDASVAPLRVPATPQQTGRFLDEGGVHELAALGGGLPAMAPESFADFVAALDAEPAKAVSIRAACQAARAGGVDPEVRAGWTDVLTPMLAGTPFTFGLPYVGGYAACDDLVKPATLFANDWPKLEAGLADGAVTDARLTYLAMFRLPAPEALSTWASVAERASSLRARRIAVQHLASYTPDLTPEELPAYRDFFVQMLTSTEVAEVLQADIRGVVKTMDATAAGNARALDALSQVLRSDVTRSVHARAVCAAFALTRGDAATWNGFLATLQGRAADASVDYVLQDLGKCP